MIQVSLYFVAGLLLGLGVLVLRFGFRSRAHQSFGTFVALVAVWVLGVAFFHSGTSLRLWAYLAFAATGLLPATFLAFAHYFPIPTEGPTKWIVRFSLLVGVVFAGLSLTTRLILKDVIITPAGPARETGLLYPLFAAYFLVNWLAALAILISKWVRALGLARLQLQYLIIGNAVGGGGAIASNLLVPLLTGDATNTWLGPHFVLISVAMNAHAIVRYRLMSVRVRCAARYMMTFLCSPKNTLPMSSKRDLPFGVPWGALPHLRR